MEVTRLAQRIMARNRADEPYIPIDLEDVNPEAPKHQVQEMNVSDVWKREKHGWSYYEA